jgi:hypothetical protein
MCGDNLTSFEEDMASVLYETFLDQQEGIYDQTYLFKVPGEHTFITLTEDGLWKCYTCELQGFLRLARLALFFPADEPVTVFFNGVLRDNEGNAIRTAMLGFCAENGVIHSCNWLTEGILRSDPVLNWDRKQTRIRSHNILADRVTAINANEMPVPGEALADPRCAKLDGPYCIELSTEDPDATKQKCAKAFKNGDFNAIKEVCGYVHLSLEQLKSDDPKEVKCFCTRKDLTGTDIEKCSTLWKDAINKYCRPKDKVPAKDWPVGHVPDVCAGGKPAQGGCFLFMSKACNSVIAGSCTQYRAAPICYNKIIFKLDGVEQNLEDCLKIKKDGKTVLEVVNSEIEANKTCYKDNVPQEVKDKIDACVKALPVEDDIRSTQPTPVRNVNK